MNPASLLPLLGGAAGAAGQGALGQATNLMSAPRRALWGALGLPEQGNELMGQTFGLDPNGLAARLGGAGAEMALDPMMPLMMGAGALGGSAIAGGLAEAGAARTGLEADANIARSAMEAGRNAMAEDAAALQAAEQANLVTADQQRRRFDSMRSFMNPDAIGTPGRTYNSVAPGVINRAEEMGMGIRNPNIEQGVGAQAQAFESAIAGGDTGAVTPYSDFLTEQGIDPKMASNAMYPNSMNQPSAQLQQGPQLALRGGLMPPMASRNAGVANPFGSVDSNGLRGEPPPFITARGRGPMPRVTLNDYGPMPSQAPTPYEQFLLSRSANQGGPGSLPSSNIHNPVDPFADVAAQRSAELAQPLPNGQQAIDTYGAGKSDLIAALTQMGALDQQGAINPMAALGAGTAGGIAGGVLGANAIKERKYRWF